MIGCSIGEISSPAKPYVYFGPPDSLPDDSVQGYFYNSSFTAVQRDVGRLQCEWQWIRSFGGPNAYSGSDLADTGNSAWGAAWRHLRRLLTNGFIYWSPNNSVCWRRPSSWPADCASAPAGENPPTDPALPAAGSERTMESDSGAFGNQLDYRQYSDITGVPCGITMGNDSDGWLDISMYTPYVYINTGRYERMLAENNSSMHADALYDTLPPIAGAIDAVADASTEWYNPSNTYETVDWQVRGTGGTSFGHSVPTQWWAMPALYEKPTAGLYRKAVVRDDSLGAWHDEWYVFGTYEEAFAAAGAVKLIEFSGDDGTKSDWATIPADMIAQGKANALAALAIDGKDPVDYGYYYPEVMLVGVTENHFRDEPVPNSIDGSTSVGHNNQGVELSFKVARPKSQYVMYEQPSSVPATQSCATTKIGRAYSTYQIDPPGELISNYALQTTSTGVAVVGNIIGFHSFAGPGNNDYTQFSSGRGLRYSGRFYGGFPDNEWRSSKYSDHYRTYAVVDGALIANTASDFDTRTLFPTQNSDGIAVAVTGKGDTMVVYDQNAYENEFFIYKVGPDGTATLAGNTIDDGPADPDWYDVYDLEQVWAGPGNRVISYDYNGDGIGEYFTLFDPVGVSMVQQQIHFPPWDGYRNADGYSGPLTWQVMSISYTGTIAWFVGEGPISAHESVSTVIGYDFASSSWTNILETEYSPDFYDETADFLTTGVGSAIDGYYFVGVNYPNQDPNAIDPTNLEDLASQLREHYIKQIVKAGNTISWGSKRVLGYDAQMWWNWGKDSWYADQYPSCGSMNGGIWTGIAPDMMTFYDPAGDEAPTPLIVQKISATGGQGHTTTSVGINSYPQQEIAWGCLDQGIPLRLIQRDDSIGINAPGSRAGRLAGPGTRNNPTSEQEGQRLNRNNGRGWR